MVPITDIYINNLLCMAKNQQNNNFKEKSYELHYKYYWHRNTNSSVFNLFFMKLEILLVSLKTKNEYCH